MGLLHWLFCRTYVHYTSKYMMFIFFVKVIPVSEIFRRKPERQCVSQFLYTNFINENGKWEMKYMSANKLIRKYLN